MPLNLSKAVVEFLQMHPEEKYIARDIANWVLKTYPAECQEKQQRSKAMANPLDTEAALLQQLVAEIGSQRPLIQKKFEQIKTTEGRPRKYYFSARTDEAEAAAVENNETTVGAPANYSEHGLYPLLSEYLWNDLKIYSKRIDEKRGKKSGVQGGNHWLYPDLIGLEDLSEDWIPEIKDCVKEVADRKTKMWSFEVKKLINRATVREYYFRAVSNSSWANYGYLVAAEIQGTETEKELRMLSGLHGIGLMKINVENPSESEILIPARERASVDWHAANRLAEENPDFLNSIKLVRQFYQTGEHRPLDWDIPKDFAQN
jgi:hypothetical protein